MEHKFIIELMELVAVYNDIKLKFKVINKEGKKFIRTVKKSEIKEVLSRYYKEFKIENKLNN